MMRETYAAASKDEHEILHSASGGVAFELGKLIIEGGGSVSGVEYSKDYHKVFRSMAFNLESLKRFRGSKYVESDKHRSYVQCKQVLETGRNVLFIGLPCEILALRKYLSTDYKNLFLCELICTGPSYKKVHDDFVSYYEEKYKSKIINMNTRYKKKGWGESWLRLEFENGKIFQKPFYKTEYGIAFSICGREACYHCVSKAGRSYADLTIGDCWGIDQEHIGYNANGTSIIIIRSEQGKKLIDSCRTISTVPYEYEKALKYNKDLERVRIKDSRRDMFYELLVKSDLFEAVKKCESRKEYWIRKCPEFILRMYRKVHILIYHLRKRFSQT